MSRPDEPEEDGGFLSGWSRRKLGAKRREAERTEVQDEPQPDEDGDGTDNDDSEGVDEAYIAALPDVDEITDGTDIRPFLAKGVPASLKNAAMRRLWLASPGVRDYSDPAVDYAWDWNAPGGVPGGGGTLSDSGISKMVKDLLGERQDETVTEVSAPGAADGSIAAQDDAHEGEGEIDADDTHAIAPDEAWPDQAVRRSGQDLQANAEPEDLPDDPDDPASTDGMSAGLAPPRRHGGAVPE